MLQALDGWASRLNRNERDVSKAIHKYGWHDTRVADPMRRRPAVNYTTGFWHSLRAPEIIVFSMADKIAHDLLCDVYHHIRTGKSLSVGRPVPDISEGIDVVFLPIKKSFRAEYLHSSLRFYGDDNFPCLQLVWPDEKNVFPWQKNFDAAFASAQPKLWQ